MDDDLKYSVLYTDENGYSHFRDVEVDFELVNFAPPAPLVGLSDFMPVAQFVFFTIPSGWFGDWHPTPKYQFFCCLSGEIELTTSDNQRRVFRSGDVFLLEDTKGIGHQTKVISKEDFVAAVIQLPH